MTETSNLPENEHISAHYITLNYKTWYKIWAAERLTSSFIHEHSRDTRIKPLMSPSPLTQAEMGQFNCHLCSYLFYRVVTSILKLNSYWFRMRFFPKPLPILLISALLLEGERFSLYNLTHKFIVFLKIPDAADRDEDPGVCCSPGNSPTGLCGT